MKIDQSSTASGEANRGARASTESEPLALEAHVRAQLQTQLERVLEVLWSGVSGQPSGPDVARLALRVCALYPELAEPHTLRLGSRPEALDRFEDVVLPGDRRFGLTKTEGAVLRHLVRRRGKLVTRHELLQEVWQSPHAVSHRTVDIHIYRLRSKLGPEYASWIETVHGLGYSLKLASTERAHETREAEPAARGGCSPRATAR